MSLLRTGDGSHSFVALMAAAIFLVGLAQIAMLPPFEDFDEAPYYSSIRQLADTGEIPLIDHSTFSPDMVDYMRHGPMPYFVIPLKGQFYTTYGGYTVIPYPQFFADPEKAKEYAQRYRTPAPRQPYVEQTSSYKNWEAQHPPLYYLLMAPIMLATDALPFVTQIFLLRLFSYAMALGGMAIAFRATLRYASKDVPEAYIVSGFGLYPFIMPSFFVEFGRIGNDSLCLLLLSAAWYFLLRWLTDLPKKKFAIATGICCGLGLFTKAFFIPIIAGILAFVMFRALRERRKYPPRRVAGAASLMLAAALAIGAWWYIFQYVHFGAVTGSISTINLNHHGGLAENLRTKFSLGIFLLGLDELITTISWSGTLSLAIIGGLQRPVYFFMMWIFILYALELWRRRAETFVWLPAFLGAPFFAGLAWCVLISVAGLRDFVGGWYMHALAPAMGLMTALALRRIAEGRKKRVVFWSFMIYAAAFLPVVFWAQASLFAACAVKAANSLYQFPDTNYCLDRWQEVAAHLAVLSWPWLAAASFAGGFLCLVLGLWKMRLFLTPEPAFAPKIPAHKAKIER